MFRKFFGRDSDSDAVHDLYACIITQSRKTEFYKELSVPDSLDGRFDMITLHMFLILRRLKKETEATADFSQKLFDLMFYDMDLSLREMGVGDVGVGKRVKAMVQGFYGRLTAYEEAVEAHGSAINGGEGPLKPAQVLESALERNLYGTVSVDASILKKMREYVEKQSAFLGKQKVEMIMSGKADFCS